MTVLNCFHCSELIDQAHIIGREIHGKQQSFCCVGCASIATMIDSNGLADFYEFRSETSSKATTKSQPNYLIYDKINIQQQYFTAIDKNKLQVQLLVEDIRCAACIWLIKARLRRLADVSKLEVDSISKIVSFEWEQDKTLLSEIMLQLHQIGYPPIPYCVENEIVQKNNYRNDILKRLGVAGLGMMQTMMFATGLYLGDSELTQAFNTSNDLASSDRSLLLWVSLLVTSFVLWYSAAPFYKSAYKTVRVGKIGMDMPISVALFIAYGASVFNMVNGHPHVYFDTVTMFTFLILMGRLAEAQTRNYLARTLSSSKNKLPILARVVNFNSKSSTSSHLPLTKINPILASDNLSSDSVKDNLIPIVELKENDVVLVKVGETIPIDGEIIDGSTWFDQSFITGESTLVSGRIGSMALAGSINTHAPIKIRAKKLSGQRLIDKIFQFKQSGHQKKPHLEMQLDFVGKYFSLAVLLIAASVYIGWSLYQPDSALIVTLSVLVISCPCALSLAVPTAQACTQSILNKNGFAVAHDHFLETLLQTTDVLFDKTGTLTEGKVSVNKVNLINRHACSKHEKQLNKDELLAIAASLEAQSEHPIAYAFAPYFNPSIKASELQYYNGEGVSGMVDGVRYFIGSPLFIRKYVSLATSTHDEKGPTFDDSSHLIMASEYGVISTIETKDQTRTDAKRLIDFLKSNQIKTHILSGDPSDKSLLLANELGIEQVKKGMLSQDKMAFVEHLNRQGSISLMIGDGINDAPVLSIAHNSIAMGSGSDLSRVSSDAVLINNQLSSLIQVFNLAKQHKKVITSNIYWALSYNLITIPLAAFGLVPPYLAAIGMSLSSLFVLWNATRLLKHQNNETLLIKNMRHLATEKSIDSHV
jgi:P-type Cu2+ transporter